MASSISILSEDQLLCSICLDVFTDPVSTPCGHNFCMICIKKYWDTSSQSQCPVCKKKFSKRPELNVNTFISGLAVDFKNSVQVKSSSSAEERQSKPESVPCDSCTEEKMEAVKSCLDCEVSFCETHLIPHRTAAKLKKHKLIDPVENLEDYICQIHEKPLEMFCRDDQTSLCHFCTLHEHNNHNTVSIEEESLGKKNQLGETRAQVQQMIQERLKKIQQIKYSLELNTINTEKEKVDSMKVFRSLISCIERNQTEMMKLMEEKQKSAEHQAEEFIKDLEQEITELKRRNTELEKIFNTEDHLHLLQVYPSLCSPPPTKNWTDTKINPYLNVESLRRALSQFQEFLNMEMEKIIDGKHQTDVLEIHLHCFFQTQPKRIRQHAVDVILDPDTAHRNLILSDDGKQVRYGDEQQNLLDLPERFNQCPCVLGKQGFTSGRFYFEVQVSGKTKWDVGVARESINRKGNITLTPENGFWCIWLRNKTEYKVCENSLRSLSVKSAPQKLGVFVDYDEGLVSFYDVENESHIYSFTGQFFNEKLYPYFCPCNNDEGENSAPLIICPVKRL